MKQSLCRVLSERNWPCRITSGSVHSYPFSFENATFSLRIGLLSKRIRWKLWPKTQLFVNALQSGNLWKFRFRVFVWTVKTELFENDDVTVLDPAYNARKPQKDPEYRSTQCLAWLPNDNQGLRDFMFDCNFKKQFHFVICPELALLLPLDLPGFCPDFYIFKLFLCKFSSS